MGLEFGVFITPVARRSRTPSSRSRRSPTRPGSTSSLPGPPVPAALPRHLDAAVVRRGAHRAASASAPNVLNLPLRPPAVMARAVASLDLLSGGRAELGLGAGAFWDAIEAMGGRRLQPGRERRRAGGGDRPDPRALGRGRAGGVRFDGDATTSSRRGARARAARTASAIWLGAYKPRMLALAGRKADGWLPSLPTCSRATWRPGNAAIDEAARGGGPRPGRDPAAAQPARCRRREVRSTELARLALEDGIGTFILMTDDPARSRRSREVAPAVRERVAAARRRRAAQSPPSRRRRDAGRGDGVRAARRHPDARRRRRGSARPLPGTSPRARTAAVRPGRRLHPRGRLVGQHLIDVHDMLRRELTSCASSSARCARAR